MSTSGIGGRAIAVLLAAIAGCKFDYALPEGAQITCQSSANCPEGYVCHVGMCARADALDTTPPDLVPDPVGSLALVAPPVGKAAATFTIDLKVTEPLAEPPEVTLALATPLVLPCATSGGLSYRCTYTATGQESQGGGVFWFDVRLQDRARNETARRQAGALHLDFRPPAVAAASVAYYPDPSNPLPSVKRATAGTVVRVAVSADELIDAAYPPTLTASRGTTTLSFELVDLLNLDPEKMTATGAAFESVVPSGAPDGSYALTLTWMDTASPSPGNTGSPATALPSVEVKTSPPELEVNQDAVVFVRSPWGNATPEDLGGYTIPAGPHFALEPGNPMATGARLPAGTFMLADGVVPTSVLVKQSAEPGALVLGTLRPDAGTWPRQPLSSPDLPTVYVVGIDDAGNESPPQSIQNVEWVATSNPPSLGTSPNTLDGIAFAGAARDAPPSTRRTLSDLTAKADTQAVFQLATAAWERRMPGISPSPRRRPAMAYDGARGRIVLFGGVGGGADASLFLRDTWEWDGTAWTNVTPSGTGPPERYSHAMAYDSARGRIVLFGGVGLGVVRQDTWEFDGTARWVSVTPSGMSPPPREGHAMAYDSARGRIVLFGGYGLLSTGDFGPLADTWEWDGIAWTQVEPGTSPTPRYGQAMAYDTARERVVLFGGTTSAGSGVAETWEWDGGTRTWTDVTPTGTSPPAGGGTYAMAFDSGRGLVVYAGSFGATWEWDGATWANRAPTMRFGSPGGHAMAYDAARGRTVLFGGFSGVNLAGTWTWNGIQWRESTPSGIAPPARARHAMAYDSARGRIVLFGGYGLLSTGGFGPLGDTWEWDGGTWSQFLPATNPSARERHAMAYDSARGRVVLFGGYGLLSTGDFGPLADTWEWDGGARTWMPVSPATSPSERYAHAMAYDSARGRVVLFGGHGPLADTWEWDGGTWSQFFPAVGPNERYDHAMAYDSARGRVVLFGGAYLLGVKNDIWEWDGSEWAPLVPLGTSPAERTRSAMTFDIGRGHIVLVGGSNAPVGGPPGMYYYYGDIWEWDGGTRTWTDVAPTGVDPHPDARADHAMAYDPERGRVILIGGFWHPPYSYSQTFFQDTWVRDGPPSRQPALQFTASASGFRAEDVTGLRVRAYAGGSFFPGDASAVGAELWGWSTHVPQGGPAAWKSLRTNAAGATVGSVPAPPLTLLDWRAATPEEARRFVTAHDGLFSFQLRPVGFTGSLPDGALVALDYIEVRVRYHVP